MLVVTLSKHFFEGAGEDEIQNGSLFLFGCFFHLTKLWVSFKSPCQIMTENKDSVCVCISTHTQNSGRQKNSIYRTQLEIVLETFSWSCTRTAHTSSHCEVTLQLATAHWTRQFCSLHLMLLSIWTFLGGHCLKSLD